MFSSMLSLLGSLRGGSSFITNSLRFRSSASAYLSRTPSVAGNRTTWTWSGWLKRGALTSGTTYTLFDASTNGSNVSWISFRAGSTDDSIGFVQTSGGTSVARKESSNLLRDPSAWYHIVVVYNSGDTASNRIIIYINGVQVTSFAGTVVDPSPNLPSLINNNVAHNIGRSTIASQYFDGYLADINFIDGQALTPALFGAIDSSTGVWAPRPYSGTYGTNGFYLKFANTSSVATLGNDSSGNNNTWTVNNVSLTAGATYDSMIDVPVNYSDGGNGRGNYCTLNPLDKAGSGVLSDANLNYSTSLSTYDPCRASISVDSGKWYWEVNCISQSGSSANTFLIGICNPNTTLTSGFYTGSDSTSYGYYGNNGQKFNAGVSSAYGASYTSGDVIGVALDLMAGTLTFYKNNVSQGTAFTGLVGAFSPIYSDGAVQGAANIAINFGQRPFTYTPPAGFRALNTNNLPTPSIVNGANFMAATTYTGNAAARSLSNAVNSVSFQPDLVWIKSRTPGATNHALFDSVRGTTKYLSSNTTTAETTLAQSLTAFGADGFSLGTDTTLVNANANSYVAWQWKAGGAAVSNTQGTITSQVSANTTAGFSVVTYTGTGVNATVGHGLGVAPKMVIVKSRSSGVDGWPVYHDSIGAPNWLALNLTNQSLPSSTFWNNTAPTSNVFSIGNNSGVNTGSGTYVAYCFAQIAGFSRFGSYTGNGLADGPFVFCGFRPRWVMVKAFSGANAGTMWWQIYDTSRDTYNVVSSYIEPNSAKVETATSSPYLDVVSNGFKLRSANGYQNDTGYNYIFAAFAEVPSKYALAR